MKNKRKNGSPKGLSGEYRVTLASLKEHASTLTKILLLLRQKQTHLTSDKLWSILKDCWKANDLTKAVNAFEKRGSISVFESLLENGREALPKVGSDGFFYRHRERWGSVKAISRTTGLGETLIASHAKRYRSCLGRRRDNRISVFYSLADVRDRLKDHLLDLPQADKSGFLHKDDDKWGTIPQLSKTLKIGERTVSLRLKHYRCVKGKTRRGYLAKFYALSDVKKACGHLLMERPRANKNGFFRYQGEEWGTSYAIAEITGLGRKVFSARSGEFRSMKGKTLRGHVETFYAFLDVKRYCKALLKKMPQANKEGRFRFEDEVWASPRLLALQLNLSEPTIRTRIRGCRSMKAKTVNGVVRDYYPISDVRERCKALLKKMPQANKEGRFRFEDEVWGTVNHLSRIFKITERTVSSYIRECRSMKAKTANGVVRDFYPISDVKEHCKALLKKMPQANNKGFFVLKGEGWGTVNAIRTSLHIGKIPSAHLKKCRMCMGRTVMRKVEKFYALSDVKEHCKALLKKMPQANNRGFFSWEGSQWGTVNAIRLRLGVSQKAVSARLKRCRSMQGRTQRGSVKVFYRIADIKRMLQSSPVRNRPRQDPVTTIALKKHANVLTQVLLRLRSTRKNMLSDQLWKLIQQRWTATQLTAAVKKYRTRKDLRDFQRLLAT